MHTPPSCFSSPVDYWKCLIPYCAEIKTLPMFSTDEILWFETYCLQMWKQRIPGTYWLRWASQSSPSHGLCQFQIPFIVIDLLVLCSAPSIQTHPQCLPPHYESLPRATSHFSQTPNLQLTSIPFSFWKLPCPKRSENEMCQQASSIWGLKMPQNIGEEWLYRAPCNFKVKQNTTFELTESNNLERQVGLMRSLHGPPFAF